ncbi:MAG TPA: site-2 protease family protein, partial [Geobacteraceae bacterium]
NFALATLSALALRGLIAAATPLPDASPLQMVLDPLVLMLAFSVYINLLLAIFNLIPVPPLDGGRVAVGLLPYRLSISLARIEPFGMIVIILLVFFTNLFGIVISPVLNAGIQLLAGPQSKLVFSVTQFLMR